MKQNVVQADPHRVIDKEMKKGSYKVDYLIC